MLFYTGISSQETATLLIFCEMATLYPMFNNHGQEGHDGPVSLHWLIHKIPSYQTLQYLKHKTSKTGLKLIVIVLMFSNTKIFKDFTIQTLVKIVTLGDKFGLRAIIYISW